MTCPMGYRVDATLPAQANSTKSASALFGADCRILRVDCSKVTCGDYVAPENSAVLREDQAIDGHGKDVLYDETLHVTCDGSFHLSSSGFTECARSFMMHCNDKGIILSDQVSAPT